MGTPLNGATDGMDGMKYIYIAGPYSQGNTMDNIQKACLVAEILADSDYVPFVPHLMAFMHLQGQRPEGYWKAIGLAWVDRCDAVFRMEGESPGADAECQRALEQGKAVHYTLKGLLRLDSYTASSCHECRDDLHVWNQGQVICQCTCGCTEERL